MDGTRRESLKARYGFSEWAGRSRLPKQQTMEPPSFTGREVPGWTLERTDQRAAGPAPARHTSFWRRGDSDAIVRIDLFACGSLDEAHEYLVDALGEFESSAIRQRADTSIGDVAFGTEIVILFARGNLVVVVRNAGREVVPVTAIARAADAAVVGRSEERPA
jgi:hypothetical protein